MLHSYHQGLDWTDAVMQGIRQGLGSQYAKFKLYVEYMDTKRHLPGELNKLLYSLYAKKYAGVKLDVIITSDDNAFDFALRHRHDLFGKAPLVFCGLNHFDLKKLKDTFDVTGIVEHMDILGTLKTALRLHPLTKHIYVINDATPTGLANKNAILKIIPKLKGQAELVFLQNYSMKALQKKLASLPRQGIVLLMSFNRDAKGNVFSYRESIDAIQSYCHLPMYGVWQFFLGRGLAGGLLLTGQSQGKTAAQLALRILKGEKAGGIPVVTKGANEYMFDYKVLKRFGVEQSLLPKGSILLNQPVSFYHQYRSLFWWIIAIVAVLVAMVLMLSANIICRRRASRALRESEQRLQDIMDFAPVLIYLKDRMGRYILINRQYSKDFGLEDKPVAGLTDFEIHPKEIASVFKENDQKVMAANGPMEFEETARPGGKPRQYISVKFPLRKSGGEIYGLCCISRDITERKFAEKARFQSEVKYRNLFNSISDLVYSHDLEGRMLSINPAATKWLGYKAEEILGRSIAKFMPPSHQKSFYRRYLKKVVSSGHAGGTMAVVAKDGSVHYMEYRNTLVELGSAKPYITGIGRDVTERILPERKLRKIKEQLSQSQKMKAVGTLASGVAHDFNNILQAVSGNVELLMASESVSHDGRKNLSEISAAIATAAELVRRLLAFGRKGGIKLTPLDLNRQVEQAVLMLKRTLPKKIELDIKLSPDVKPIRADAVQLEQIIMNLGINAVDAMPNGGKLTIESANITTLGSAYLNNHFKTPPGEYVLLRVSDTGTGMDKKTLKRIYEPFFTTKGQDEGTGLGLSTVYGVVQNHHGYIDCKSQLGRGTEFSIYFPASDRPAGRESHSHAESMDNLSGHERILMVDDDQAVLKIGRQGLSQFGYQVITAGSGEKALEIYQSQKETISLVILDLNMPGMGGQSCLEKIIEINPKARVLVSSGLIQDDTVQNVSSAGAAGFMSKPYRLTALAQKIRQVLDQTGSEQALSS